MAKDCVSARDARIMRAAIIASIHTRKIRQKDIVKAAKVRPQHVHDVLHAGKAISLRMHAAFKAALRKAYPDLAEAARARPCLTVNRMPKLIRAVAAQ